MENGMNLCTIICMQCTTLLLMKYWYNKPSQRTECIVFGYIEE